MLDAFFNRKFCISHRGNLRKMGHAEHLPPFGHGPELERHLLCGPSAHARVDLVENQRRHAVLLREHLLHGEHDSGQLAARSNL